MLNNINFTGSVIKAPNMQKPVSKTDRDTMQEYADKHDVDVHVLNKETYCDGEGKYTTAVIGNDGKAFIKVFNMKFPECSHLYQKDNMEALYECPECLKESDIVDENIVFN